MDRRRHSCRLRSAERTAVSWGWCRSSFCAFVNQYDEHSDYRHLLESSRHQRGTAVCVQTSLSCCFPLLAAPGKLFVLLVSRVVDCLKRAWVSNPKRQSVETSEATCDQKAGRASLCPPSDTPIKQCTGTDEAAENPGSLGGRPAQKFFGLRWMWRSMCRRRANLPVLSSGVLAFQIPQRVRPVYTTRSPGTTRRTLELTPLSLPRYYCNAQRQCHHSDLDRRLLSATPRFPLFNFLGVSLHCGLSFLRLTVNTQLDVRRHTAKRGRSAEQAEEVGAARWQIVCVV